MAKKSELPDKLSELIMVAVADAKKLDRSKYYPYFKTYHDKTGIAPDGLCEICDAGAVIAGTLNGDTGLTLAPSSFMSDDVARKLYALDAARDGDYDGALFTLEKHTKDTSEAVRHVPVSPYSQYEGWEEFDKHLDIMKGVAKQLKELGY